jgi:hypothetical protein
VPELTGRTSEMMRDVIKRAEALDEHLELEHRRLQSQDKAVAKGISEVSARIGDKTKEHFGSPLSTNLSFNEETGFLKQERQHSFDDDYLQPRIGLIGNDQDSGSEISSIMSAQSFWTLSSSSRSSLPDIMTAVDELVAMLTRDPLLQCLSQLEPPRMVPEKFERNLAQLLQRYLKHLKTESVDVLHFQAARFFGSRNRLIATKVKIEFDPRSKMSLNKFSTEKLRLKEYLERFLKQFRPSGRDRNGDPSEAEENSSENSDTSQAENSFENFSKVKEFLMESTTFVTLREGLTAFVDPSATPYPGSGKQIPGQGKAKGRTVQEVDYRYRGPVTTVSDWSSANLFGHLSLRQKYLFVTVAFKLLLRPPLVKGFGTLNGSVQDTYFQPFDTRLVAL